MSQTWDEVLRENRLGLLAPRTRAYTMSTKIEPFFTFLENFGFLPVAQSFRWLGRPKSLGDFIHRAQQCGDRMADVTVNRQDIILDGRWYGYGGYSNRYKINIRSTSAELYLTVDDVPNRAVSDLNVDHDAIGIAEALHSAGIETTIYGKSVESARERYRRAIQQFDKEVERANRIWFLTHAVPDAEDT